MKFTFCTLDKLLKNQTVYKFFETNKIRRQFLQFLNRLLGEAKLSTQDNRNCYRKDFHF